MQCFCSLIMIGSRWCDSFMPWYGSSYSDLLIIFTCDVILDIFYFFFGITTGSLIEVLRVLAWVDCFLNNDIFLEVYALELVALETFELGLWYTFELLLDRDLLFCTTLWLILIGLAFSWRGGLVKVDCIWVFTCFFFSLFFTTFGSCFFRFYTSLYCISFWLLDVAFL